MQIDITKEGKGRQIPHGCEVRVHYVGRLENGEIFDSSYGHGQPLAFQLGVGQVIKCWDTAIQQLKKGSEATLTCPPDVAYGEHGSGSLIPPNATLTFDVKVMGYSFY